jgi:hypothetical protein
MLSIGIGIGIANRQSSIVNRQSDQLLEAS